MKNLIIISGPSGVGKTTISNLLVDRLNLEKVITCTTRNKRNNEIENKDYYFISKEQFVDMIKNEEFLEYNNNFNNFYGSPINEIDRIHDNNKIPILIIDPDAANNLKKKYGSSILTIFLKTKNFSDNINRLKTRNDGTNDIELRMNQIYNDILNSKYFDFVVDNDDIEDCFTKIKDKINNFIKTSKPLVINLFGGPGCGKSTTASRIFSHLKMNGYKCELVTEFAKDLTWRKNFKELSNQIYVFGEQHNRLHQLKNEVEVIVTDAPLLLSLIYSPKDLLPYLEPLVLHEINKFDNLNILLSRTKKYMQYGRSQSEDEAKQIDNITKNILEKFNINYNNFNYPIDEKLNELLEIINHKLNK